MVQTFLSLRVGELAMDRWPDFFIVGAPRAGTTSLYYYLRAHPDIYMPALKEPHFFIERGINSLSETRKLRYLPPKIITKQEDYLRLFSNARDAQVAGEASVFYLSDEFAPVKIKEINPRAKIIMLLREPVERAHSTYLLAAREGSESSPSFYEALQEDYKFMVKFSASASVYISPGLYYQHIKRYLEIFKREQLCIYLYDDLVSDTGALVNGVCSFLGASPYKTEFSDLERRYNIYAEPRNNILKWLESSRWLQALAISMLPRSVRPLIHDRLVNRKASKPPLDPKAQGLLQSIYHDDTLRLQELIGRDLSSWLTY
jgi:Sulfotransferase domain